VTAGPAEHPDLEHAPLTVEEVIHDASNLTVRVRVGTGGAAVYKPVAGERPLHDFPLGSLAGREVAAYRLSRLGGWDLVPLTLLREGPLGPGAVQAWVDQSEAEPVPASGLVDIVAPGEVRPGWLPVAQARGEDGRPLLVVHADDPVLRSVTVLDAVLNNADRKASHLLRDRSGRLWGIDHGLCLHGEDKLRTVFWGWAGEPLPDADVQRLGRLRAGLGGSSRWDGLLTGPEVRALARRVDVLLETGRHPEPPSDRYPLPWPLW
jgi:uncharacterized repeat protein (TIGR03843 family)